LFSFLVAEIHKYILISSSITALQYKSTKREATTTTAATAQQHQEEEEYPERQNSHPMPLRFPKKKGWKAATEKEQQQQQQQQDGTTNTTCPYEVVGSNSIFVTQRGSSINNDLEPLSTSNTTSSNPIAIVKLNTKDGRDNDEDDDATDDDSPKMRNSSSRGNNNNNSNNNNNRRFPWFSKGKNVRKNKTSLEDAGIDNVDGDGYVNGNQSTDRERIMNDKYNTGAGAPSMLDQDDDVDADDIEEEEKEEEDSNIRDVNNLLEDPYAELEGRQYAGKDPDKNNTTVSTTEALMNDRDYEQEQEAKRELCIVFLSKMVFLVGAILFLVLAVQDLQRIQTKNTISTSSSGATESNSMPVFQTNNTTAVEARNDDNEISDGTQKVADTHIWETRYLQQVEEEEEQEATNWYTEYWDELPPVIREAAMLLGYDQQTWDAAGSVYTDRLYWHQLTTEQQQAAILVFGYNEMTWNNFVEKFLENLATTPAPSLAVASGTTENPTFAPVEDQQQQEEGATPTADNDVYFKNLWWNQLPLEVQQAATTLGYTEETWNADQDPLFFNLFWDQLTGEEQEAASTMGYTQTTWDASKRGGNGGPNPSQNEANNNQGEEDQNLGGEENSENNDISSIIVGNNDMRTNFPPEARGVQYQTVYIFAALCMVLVGILDGCQQKLAFHVVMVLAGITGVMAGGFTMFSNKNAFHACHSLSTHFFLLQTIFVIFSRLLLTYDNIVRKTLAVGDGLFAGGALVNVVVSYLRYDTTTPAMAKSAVAASIFWCVAGLIYVGITILFWMRQNKTWKYDERRNGDGDESSIAESCVLQVPSGGGECEISYQEPSVSNNAKTDGPVPAEQDEERR